MSVNCIIKKEASVCNRYGLAIDRNLLCKMIIF